MQTLRNHFILATVLVAVCGVLILTGQQRPAGPFTADQAAAGSTVFQANCAGCHGADLGGRNAGELLNFMEAAMPPGNATLGEQNYINLAAFILSSNGAQAGASPLAA